MRCSAAIIELLRYSRFGDELLLLELAYANNGLLEKRTPKPARAVALAASSATHYGSDQPHTATPKPQGPDRSFAEIKASLSAPLLHTLAALEDLTQSFSDNVRCKELRLYTAFKTLRNFASVVLQRGMYQRLGIGVQETLRCPSPISRSYMPWRPICA